MACWLSVKGEEKGEQRKQQVGMQETEQNSGVDSISVHMCVLLDFQKHWTDMRVRDVTTVI